MPARRLSCIRVSTAAAALSAVALSVASPAASQQRPAVRMRLEVRKPTGCPSDSDLANKVRERSSVVRLAEAHESAYAVSVEITSASEATPDSAFEATVRVVDPRGATGTRTLRGPTCEQVFDAAALVIALDLESRATQPPTPETPQPNSPASQPQEVPLRWRFSIGGTVGKRGDVAPESGLSLGGFVEAGQGPVGQRAWNPRLALGLTATQGHTSWSGPLAANYDLRLIAPFAKVCFLGTATDRFVLTPCAAVEVPVHTAFLPQGTKTRVRVGGGLSLKGRLRLVESLWLEVEPAFVTRVGRASFAAKGADGGTYAFETPDAAFVATASLLWTF